MSCSAKHGNVLLRLIGPAAWIARSANSHALCVVIFGLAWPTNVADAVDTADRASRGATLPLAQPLGDG